MDYHAADASSSCVGQLPLVLWSHIMMFTRVGSPEFRSLRIVCHAFAIEGIRHAGLHGVIRLIDDEWDAAAAAADDDDAIAQPTTDANSDGGCNYMNKVVSLRQFLHRYAFLHGMAIATYPYVAAELLLYTAASKASTACIGRLILGRESTSWRDVTELINFADFVKQHIQQDTVAIDFGLVAIDESICSDSSSTDVLFSKLLALNVHGLTIKTQLWITARNILMSNYARSVVSGLVIGRFDSKIDISNMSSSCNGFELLGSLNKFVLYDCPNVIDVSALTRIRSLVLVRCMGLVDVHMLADVPILSLWGCRNITDVSTLGRQIRLDLSRTGVSDVSMLGGVRHLNLRGCSKVKDVAALGNCDWLDLSETPIQDVSALRNVRYLRLESCLQLSDVSALGNQEFLDLSYSSVTNVSSLGHVDTLILSHTNVATLSSLLHVRCLDLTECKRFRDVSALANSEFINLSYSDVVDVSALGSVRRIEMRECKLISDCSALGNCMFLNLRDTDVSDVSMLGHVSWLDLGGCKGVTDASGLTGCKYLNLWRTGVTDFRMLSNVPMLMYDKTKQINV